MYRSQFLASHPHLDVVADFNDEVDQQLFTLLGDFRQSVFPQVGGVFV